MQVPKRPLSPGELTDKAKKLAAYRLKPVSRKLAASKNPEGYMFRSKDEWGNPSSVVNDIRKEF